MVSVSRQRDVLPSVSRACASLVPKRPASPAPHGQVRGSKCRYYQPSQVLRKVHHPHRPLVQTSYAPHDDPHRSEMKRRSPMIRTESRMRTDQASLLLGWPMAIVACILHITPLEAQEPTHAGRVRAHETKSRSTLAVPPPRDRGTCAICGERSTSPSFSSQAPLHERRQALLGLVADSTYLGNHAHDPYYRSIGSVSTGMRTLTPLPSPSSMEQFLS